MDSILEKRRKTYESRGLTAQPAIIEVRSDKPLFYVRADQIVYSFDSALKPLDISFKMHFVLNLKYAHKLNQTYLFIQKFIFKLDTKYDKVSPALSVILAQL